MNVNFGLFPPLADKVRKADRKLGMTSRARTDFALWHGVMLAQAGISAGEGSCGVPRGVPAYAGMTN